MFVTSRVISFEDISTHWLNYNLRIDGQTNSKREMQANWKGRSSLVLGGDLWMAVGNLGIFLEDRKAEVDCVDFGGFSCCVLMMAFLSCCLR